MSAAGRLVRAGLLAAALCSGGALAVPLPAQLEDASSWRQVGHGEARWWGLSLYHAALWARSAEWSANRPFALALHYSRDFSSKRLVDASIGEIDRLFAPAAERLELWREELTEALPDVRAGDILTGVFRPGAGVAFYLGDQLHFESTDADLAERFFAIWLDSRSRLPELRARLLGHVDDR